MEVSPLFIERSNESRECILRLSVSRREPSLFLLVACAKAEVLYKTAIKIKSSEHLNIFFIG